MIVKSIEFIRSEIPFNTPFSHANYSRESGTTVFVQLETVLGTTALGEILPRSYVTGETVDSILGSTATPGTAQLMAEALLGQYFPSQYALVRWIESWLDKLNGMTALFGGVEIALWGLMAQEHQVNLDWLLGSVRQRPTGRCLTIGFDVPTTEFRRWIIHSRLTKATAIKLKMGQDCDGERISVLASLLPPDIHLRLDVNGGYTLHELEDLLQFSAGRIHLHSIEDPLQPDSDNFEHLPDLTARFEVPFVVDEGLVSFQDARACVHNGYFQYANLRIGKQGGLYITRLMRDYLSKNGIEILAGSMVGETRILSQASELLLARSNCIDYVEGLQENEKLLASDPLELKQSDGPLKIFTLSKTDSDQSVQYRLINRYMA